MQTLKEKVELGWQESQRGKLVNGPAVFAEIRKLSRAKRAAAKPKR